MISVAGLSVVSSAAVALGGLVVTYLGGREQRSHEKGLAFEERAWSVKSDAHFQVITICRDLIDVITSPRQNQRERLALGLMEVRADLSQVLPIIETYAAPSCRTRFEDLRALLQSANVDVMLTLHAQDVRQQKEAALDAQDFESAARLRDEERQLQTAAAEGLGIDPEDVRVKAAALIDAARDSLRG